MIVPATVDQPLVSVIVPAYNAAATLGETLSSIVSQQYAAMDIIVVDDGSTDATRAVAGRFADADDRIRIVSIPNGGVAAARNAGIALATGDIVAPIDADDLWHPSYLATLVGLLRAAPPDTVLAYAACRLIDAGSMIIGSGPGHVVTGFAPYRMQYCNVVGNGSGMIIVKRAILQVGGYDTRLREAGCQGYEDYLLQVTLASVGGIVGTNAFLVGYRQGMGTMSQDRDTMFASRKLAARIQRDRFPQLHPPPWLARWIAGEERLINAESHFWNRRAASALRLFIGAATVDPIATITAIGGRARSILRRGLGSGSTERVRFLNTDPHRGATGMRAAEKAGLFVRMQRRRLKIISRLDTQCRPIDAFDRHQA